VSTESTEHALVALCGELLPFVSFISAALHAH